MAQRQSNENRIALPKLSGVLSGPIVDQIAIYKKCKLQLDPISRDELELQGRALLTIKDVEIYVNAIEAYWERQRELCRRNPDFFEWPETKVWFGDGNLQVDNWEKVGALKLFGYAVNREMSLDTAQRHEALHVVFSAPIPPFASWAHVKQWNEPGSAQRLQKMANCLASFARNGQHMRQGYMQLPVEKWIADLSHLRERYYRDRFNFDWPDPATISD